MHCGSDGHDKTTRLFYLYHMKPEVLISPCTAARQMKKPGVSVTYIPRI